MPVAAPQCACGCVPSQSMTHNRGVLHDVRHEECHCLLHTVPVDVLLRQKPRELLHGWRNCEIQNLLREPSVNAILRQKLNHPHEFLHDCKDPQSAPQIPSWNAGTGTLTNLLHDGSSTLCALSAVVHNSFHGHAHWQLLMAPVASKTSRAAARQQPAISPLCRRYPSERNPLQN